MAGRIPQAFIDDLLARVSVLDIVDARVKLKRTGKNHSGLCPFHKEKSPSFTVNNEKQFYYCFGCGAGGNSLSFLMEHDRLSFPEAVEELAKLAGVDMPKQEGPVDHQREQRIKDIYALLEDASAYYQQQLREHPNKATAVNYLKDRGLTGQIAARFGIGYAPPGWDNLLKKLAKDDATKQRLEQAGMLINKEDTDRFYDRFRERIMFPIRDSRGRVIAFGGRVLGDEKPKYLNSPETDTFHKGRELYGLYEARKFNQKLDRLIIVEGYMDVVGLAQYGINYAVATLGTATSAQHLDRIFRTVQEVIFCFDGDAAGRKAAKRALDTTLPVITDGKQARFLFLPEGEDPDSLVRIEGNEAFEKRLNEALPLSDFFFKTLEEGADMTSLDGRARYSNQALPMIDEMQPGILKQMMQEKISDLTGLSLEQLSSVNNLQEATAVPPAATQGYYQETSGYSDDSYSDFQSSEYKSADYQNHDYQDHDYQNYDYQSGDFQSKGNKRKSSRKFGKDKRKPRPAPPGGSAVHINPSSSAVSILLHMPSLANQCGDLSFLKDSDNNTDQLLLHLSSHMLEHPGVTPGILAIDWQDEDHLRPLIHQLNEIAHQEPIIDSGNAQKVLQDCLIRLQERHLDREILKLKSQPHLSSDDKTRLNQLIMQQATSRIRKPTEK
ncbi:DNA primase [Amphritea balenae]|uniref:DNA primase n=1 Tax=Amphritea balenae TaxID=452629 RepID=A0A3P1SPT3_9GAMM|nr:DNA primase [Amphritea balenae]RRC99178.1 DNA primase [Amphritea balenae]GGK73300.1 DNA primase [Amphritea balenae]